MTDPILTDHRITTLEPQPSLAVRVRVPMEQLDLGALFAAHLPRLQAAAGDGGPPYGRYHEFGPSQADVEIGIPLGDPPPDLPTPTPGESNTIESSMLPGGPTAVVIHHGSYDSLGAAYDQLHEWVHSQGYEEGPGPWESYIDDPGEIDDVSRLRTALYSPLVEK
jgi:effector-binding domain-containing protein